jgi:hypothetical protein
MKLPRAAASAASAASAAASSSVHSTTNSTATTVALHGACAKSTRYGPWEECPTVAERFPHAKGQVLDSVIKDTYVLYPSVTIPWFTDQGTRTMFVDPSNKTDRNQSDTIRRYCDLMKSKGLISSCAGAPVAYLSSPSSSAASSSSPSPGESYFMLAASHRVEAAYLAFQEAPQNPQIQCMRAAGLQGCIVVHAKCPADIKIYFKNVANAMNSVAAKTSFIEGYEAAPNAAAKFLLKRKQDKAAAAAAAPARAAPSTTRTTTTATTASTAALVGNRWRRVGSTANSANTNKDQNHSGGCVGGDASDDDDDDLAAEGDDSDADVEADGEKKNKKRSQAGYETEYWKWLKDSFTDYTDWVTWADYDNCKKFRSRMDRLGLWDAYRDYCQAHCKFTDASISNNTIFAVNLMILNEFEKHPDHVDLLIPTLAFAIPTNDNVPWEIKSTKDAKAVQAC